MKRNRIVGLLFFSGLLAASAAAQLSAEDRAAVDSYKSVVKRAQTGKAARRVEAAFEAITTLRDALTREVADGGTLLESLPDADYQRLEKELKGVLINREEIILVRPDNDFWIKLAATKGYDADKAFFAAFYKTYPDDVWPVYNEQQTDVTGCTRFGSLSLVSTYRLWTKFKVKFGSRYGSAVKVEVDAVLEELTQSTCACGTKAQFKRELEEFNRAFPKSPVRSKIDKRLRDLRLGRSEVRASCQSG